MPWVLPACYGRYVYRLVCPLLGQQKEDLRARLVGGQRLGRRKEHNNDHAARQHYPPLGGRWFPDEPARQPATRGEIPGIGEDASQVVVVVRVRAPVEFPGGLLPLAGPRGPRRGAIHPL